MADDDAVTVIAEPFAIVPPALQRLGESSRWAAEVLGVDSVGSFLEGPTFGPDGTLYVSDLAHGRIFLISPAGHIVDTLECGDHPNGLAFHADGRLFIADYGRGILALVPGAEYSDAGRDQVPLRAFSRCQRPRLRRRRHPLLH